MKTKKNKGLFLLPVVAALICLAVASCSGGAKSINMAVVGDTLVMRHASLLTMVECDGYTVADVKNPWSGGAMSRYILVDKGASLPGGLPSGRVLRIPLDSMLVFSTVHAELICSLGCADAIKGVCEAQYMTQPAVAAGLASGAVADCGSSLNINVERVVQLSPQAVWVLPYENGGYGKLDKLPYTLVECVEYMENSPLAAAEWVRFYGRLLGRASVADSLFAVVESSYLSLRDSLARCTSRPTLMCELKSSSAWYMPAAKSTMGQLYSDAGADYLFSSYDGSGSVPLAFETVLHRAADADLWLIKYGGAQKTYKSLTGEYGGYVHFRPYKERRIFACNLSERRFYEETPFRPDILLRELASIFHPEITEGYKRRYYEELEEE